MNKKTDILEREYVELSSKNWSGLVAIARQYKKSAAVGSREETPVYVALEGSQPEDLCNALTELYELRKERSNRISNYIESQLEKAKEEIEETKNEVIEQIENHYDWVKDQKKPWWRAFGIKE